GIEDDFVGVVDVLTKQAYVRDDTGLPENYKIEEVPADMVDKVNEYHEMLVESAVEQDDDLMMAYMDGEEPSIEDLKRCIHKGTRTMAFFPTYCGSAFKNK
ncbi:elongation factor G, partial [Alteromonadaceae bacterium M269]